MLKKYCKPDSGGLVVSSEVNPMTETSKGYRCWLSE